MKFKLVENNDLLEMAMDRSSAIDRCIPRGKNFIEHFDKIYNNQNCTTINHWIGEMASWLKDVCELKLKPKGRHIFISELYDWFFSCGALASDYIPNEEECEMYDAFVSTLCGSLPRLIRENDFSNLSFAIKDSMKDVGMNLSE